MRASAAVDHRSAAAGWLFAGSARFDSRVWQIDYEHARAAGERLSALELDGLFLGGLSSKPIGALRAPWNPERPTGCGTRAEWPQSRPQSAFGLRARSTRAARTLLTPRPRHAHAARTPPTAPAARRGWSCASASGPRSCLCERACNADSMLWFVHSCCEQVEGPSRQPGELLLPWLEEGQAFW